MAIYSIFEKKDYLSPLLQQFLDCEIASLHIDDAININENDTIFTDAEVNLPKNLPNEQVIRITKQDDIRTISKKIEAIKKGPKKIHLNSNVWLDLTSRNLCAGQNKIALTEKETELLQYLHLNQGLNVKKEKILHDIWQYGEQIDSSTLVSHIYRLRQKIKEFPIEIESENGSYCLKL